MSAYGHGQASEEAEAEASASPEPPAETAPEEAGPGRHGAGHLRGTSRARRREREQRVGTERAGRIVGPAADSKSTRSGQGQNNRNNQNQNNQNQNNRNNQNNQLQGDGGDVGNRRSRRRRGRSVDPVVSSKVAAARSNRTQANWSR